MERLDAAPKPYHGHENPVLFQLCVEISVLTYLQHATKKQVHTQSIW